MINISEVKIGAEEEELVIEVLRSGRLAQGPMVERLEGAFAAAHDSDYAVAVNNGTTALVAAILALDLQPGDEVITTPFSFIATLNAILEAGAIARFADIGDDFCIDPTSVESLIGPRTRALLPVHLYGLPADMPRLDGIAKRRHLAMIEDAAQAHGARIEGRSVGTFGIGCFSLYATKNITAGEGGVITTGDARVADRIRLLRNQGMRGRYEYVIPGHNFRMMEVQAAIAIPQMQRLKEISLQRRENAAALTEGLDGISGLALPLVPEAREHVFHQFTVRITEDAALDRSEVVARLSEAGIATGIYYPRLMPDYECYQGHPQVGRDETPRARATAAEALSLPVHQYLSGSDLEKIIDAVRTVLT